MVEKEISTPCLSRCQNDLSNNGSRIVLNRLLRCAQIAWKVVKWLREKANSYPIFIPLNGLKSVKTEKP